MLRTPCLLAGRGCLVMFVVAAGTIPVGPLWATEPAPAETAADVADLQRFAAQLDAPEFAQRQEASHKLAEAGSAAFMELERVAAGSSREASDRALEIFKRQFQRGDSETQTAARGALERLSQHAVPSLAQRARYVLDPPPAPPPTMPLPLQARQARIRLQVNAPAMRRQIEARNVNGRQEIEIVENGRRQKLQIAPDGKIEAEVTETINGKQTTRKFAAKDLDDLRRQDAELARSYERTKPRARAAAPAVPAEIRDRLSRALEAQIQQMKEQLPGNPNLQRAIDAIEAQKQRIETLPR
jgi:hypothetical protein